MQREPQDYFESAKDVSTDDVQWHASVPMPTVEPTGPNSTSTGRSSKGTTKSYADDDAFLFDRYPAEHVLSAAAAGNIDSISTLSGPKEVGFFDWTRLPVSDSLPRHIQFARSVDWGKTALGPIDTWTPDLRQMCNLIMASPHPAAMYWGEDLVAIYNEAYVLLAGQKHPTLMVSPELQGILVLAPSRCSSRTPLRVIRSLLDPYFQTLSCLASLTLSIVGSDLPRGVV